MSQVRAHDESAPLPPEDKQPDAGSTAGVGPLASRARVLILVFVALIVAVVARLLYWQVFTGKSPEMASAAAAPPPADTSRGRIVDAHGLLLASDDFTYDIYANPAVIASSKLSVTVPISLTEVLGLSFESVAEQLASRDSLVVLTKSGTYAQCRTINDGLDRPELVWCEPKRKRVYPQGSLAAHAIGFTNFAQTGLYGVEATFDTWLRSDANWPYGDFRNPPQPLPDAWRTYLPSPNGRDLALYLDAPLQHMVEKRLRESVVFYGAEKGTIIIMDPRTGGILSMAAYPGFDLNTYSEVEPDRWVNPALGQVYEPGSVFKVITMAAALDSGEITPETPFNDTGSIEVSGKTIFNAENKVYGQVTVREALANSINVISARIALDLGPEAFYSYVRRFGFGRQTEVDLSGESAGFVKERGNPEWSPIDEATNSFGQGISVTALQMTNAVAAIANKGVLLRPRITQAMVQDGRVHTLPEHVIGRPIRPETAKTLTDMMVFTMSKPVYGELVPGFKVAGKTGTAEIPTLQGYTLKETITTFIGFLPADDPQLVIMIKLDKPKRSRWAESVVAPVFGEVAQDAVRILDINP